MFKVGDRVLAQWPTERVWWYPGTVIAESGDGFDVQYDDGDRANLKPEQVKPLDVGIGSRVYGRWQGGGSYFAGKVSEVNGQAIHINYDDGDQEWSTVGMIRINQNDL